MHEDQAFPCKIHDDCSNGRYLIATKSFAAGELIFQESPLMIGPCGIGMDKSKDFSTCLGCYKNVSSFYKCSKCGWPVCNATCEAIPDHAEFECTVFAECPVSPITNPPEYDRIKILRCLMLKEKYPERWKMLMQLESRSEIRKQSFYDVSNIVSHYKFIKQECDLTQYTFDEIHHVAGASAINSFSTSCFLGHHSDGVSRYASFLFYYGSLVSHDCFPNTKAIIQQKGRSYVMNVVATTNINAGDVISSSYVEEHVGTHERCDYLMRHFYLPCKCQRCQDSTELGSYFSAVKCPNSSCNTGYLLPKNPMDAQSDWECGASDCDKVVGSSWVVNLLSDVKNRSRKCQKLEDFEMMLKNIKGHVLHKNHYLIVNIEFEIIRYIHGILPENDAVENMRLVKLQIEFCRHCLSIADLISPGQTRFRGLLLYHLHDALLTQCKLRVDQCKDTKDMDIVRKRCKKQFAEALEIMKESKTILMAEPVGSSDWEKGTSLTIETPRIKSLMNCLSFIE